ncbi:hypothetical protein [Propionicicella superfundia]|uniref:hypothetical protein n=1 Tax=Propionicicella superfundia TaxID=348582 RepID=UPI0012EBAA76|nr:hypothetical protein [Propionicicella superfundia]
MRYRVVESPKTRLRLRHENIQILSDRVWPSLQSLLHCRDSIRRLIVTAPLRDISLVNDFELLEELDMWPRCAPTGSIVLSRLTRLRSLTIDRGVDVDMDEGRVLEELYLEAPYVAWNEFLRELPVLKSLSLISPRKLPGILPESLRSLEISVFRRGPERHIFQGIEGVTRLDLTGVRGMSDLRSFSAIRELELLYAEDCDELASLNGPGLSPRFALHLIGRTKLASNEGRG